ncbi:MAG: hypothetical protein JW881_17545 [Spirochaetales bacterium]|nr:hypothetical protein [Spirochaetales bacterium]
MIKSVLHEFHFVLSDSMRNKLNSLKLFGPKRSLSGVIIGIMSLVDPLIVREHQWGRQRMSRYQSVSDNPDERRRHAHVYFTEDVYRKIKLLHADLNCFSIAQLLRWLLEVFLVMMEKYGNKVIDEFEKRFRQWSSEEKSIQQIPQKKLRQLFRIIQHLPGRNSLISMYMDSYSPFWILRL